MTTTVKHEGKVRSWEGSIESWQAHSEVITHWCDGAEVGCVQPGGEIFVADEPAFRPECEYRVKQRKPKAGEVWDVDGRHCVYYQGMNDYEFSTLDGTTWLNKDHDWEMKYITPNLKSYYAKEFLKHSTSKDCGFDYDNATKLLSYIKQLAGECNE